MICRKCGRENLDSSQSCAYCGTSMEPSLPKEPAAPKEPGLNELSSDGNLSAAMLSSAKAASSKGSTNPKGPASVKSVKAPLGTASTASAVGTAAGAGAASSVGGTAAYVRPPSGQMPYARQPAPPLPKAKPQTSSDGKDEFSELPPISAKTKRNLIIGLVAFFVLIFFSNAFEQCSRIFINDNSFGNQPSIGNNASYSNTDPEVSIVFENLLKNNSSSFLRQEGVQGSYMALTPGENKAYLNSDGKGISGGIANLTGILVFFDDNQAMKPLGIQLLLLSYNDS